MERRRVTVVGGVFFRAVMSDENGRFGWISDPEGDRIELWQPPDGR